MKPTKDDIRRRLGLREVPKPPDDLMRRLKADIPSSFRYTNHAVSGRKGDASSAAFRGMSWQVAASFLLLTLGGVGIYMVTFETQKMETAKIAESDKAPEREFSPPMSPAPASAPASTLDVEQQKLQKEESRMQQGYDIPAPPPPPPSVSGRMRDDAALAQEVETGVAGGVEGGVEGGVYGGVPGGVVGGVVGGVAAGVASNEAASAAAKEPLDSDDFAPERPAEAPAKAKKDLAFGEETKISATAPAPAVAQPAAAAGAGTRDEKRAAGVQPEPVSLSSPNDGVSVDVLRAKAAAGEPLRVGGIVRPPVILDRVSVIYPTQAKEARVQGVVIVEAVISRDGKLKDLKVLKELPLGLTEAAVAAVKQWKFKPATLEGKPVDAYFLLVVNAKLDE